MQTACYSVCLLLNAQSNVINWQIVYFHYTMTKETNSEMGPEKLSFGALYPVFDL